MTEYGSEYRGTHNRTKTGKLCQRWDRQSPNPHSYTDVSKFPDDNLFDAADFCRNPDNDPDGPWSYTLDSSGSRESCGLPACSGKVNSTFTL